MSERILLVEDEEKLARMIELELNYEGYEVEKALDGRRGLELALTGGFDLILLDIMLTARDSVMDKVAGLDSGADDYITKPFAIEELLARIRAALRNKSGQANIPLAVGPLVMDVEKHQVMVRGQNVELTKKEFDLLRHLLENKDRVLTREALLDAVWGFDFVGETNSVDVYIRFLRSKLDDAFGLKLIHTVRGVGYVIKEE